MDERRTDTREQIRKLALELFAERGYDGTSLREIADHLGITKAAVYYHFKTKEEILASLVNDFFTEIDELISWAQQQPPSAASREQVLRRYQAL
ncbi:MAG: TetR/AcrR family transcriptional regulator, partial [Actinomycetota bacterium]|nr:TetR/AcrR family transcriptional regulator [Actinomycetota bacterium]